MHPFIRWRTKTLHHLFDEMARAIPSPLDFDWPSDEVQEIVADQRVVTLPYRDFSGHEHLGQLVVHRELVAVVTEIFEHLFDRYFPIASMVPIVAFDWNDDRSMAANNCVGFHFRKKTGKDELSWHAYGRAIDINPLQNPYIRDGIILPNGAKRDLSCCGTCDEFSLPVQLFKAHGFIWGGEWTSLKDYMHFELPAPP